MSSGTQIFKKKICTEKDDLTLVEIRFLNENKEVMDPQGPYRISVLFIRLTYLLTYLEGLETCNLISRG